MREKDLFAVLHAQNPPTPEQEEGIKRFLKEKYGFDFSVVWRQNKSCVGGFKLFVGSEVYDWTTEGRLSQLERRLHQLSKAGAGVLPLIRQEMEDFSPQAFSEEVGQVQSVADGVATVSGLPSATYGEILLFAGGVRGMVQNLAQNELGCILFEDGARVVAGSRVFRTGKMAGIPVGEAYLGRVVDALGSPIDGKGAIESRDYRAVEAPAPSIVDRQPVSQAMETGLLAIDAMFPIGRGQRELIVGDRQTGKTAVALDTIVNQRGKDVICIYVAIGQKASSVAQLVGALKKHGAMDYTIVVNAAASAPAPLQYIAPYAGTALGEYFMQQGKDVLIVYDDLSKHAVAYRSLSLLLGRAPGREAYPGDVFYLHSRLLERSAHLSDELGGGSMTALPIVETQAGDVSAYIPTNIISITDGQIFLESELFNAGQRPAVNVGLSVSRVGRDAQTKAVKTASGTLRIDLAQYREMKIFTQFSSDLEESTKEQLEYGQSLMQMLCQPQYRPYRHYQEVILLVAGLQRAFRAVPLRQQKVFLEQLLQLFDSEYRSLCERIDRTGRLQPEDEQEIVEITRRAAADFVRDAQEGPLCRK